MIDAIHNGAGERLDFAWHDGDPDRRDLLVLGHGVTANKDRPFLVALADAAAAAGIHTLRVSFAGNGDSEGRFEDATVTKEVGDLGAVLDAVGAATAAASETAGGAPWRIVYAGHSMGAAVGVLRAAEDPRIQGLVSLAGMVHVHDFAQRKFGDQQPGASCMWDKPECPLSQAYMDDMAALQTVVGSGGSIHVPWLLVHGTEDTVVPLKDAEDIREVAPGSPELVLLPGADHVFSGAATDSMVAAVVPWLQRAPLRPGG